MTFRFLATLAALLALALGGCSESRLPALPDGGDFVLQSAAGPFDTKALRGKVLLVYFGYANCPDICPASLSNGGQALNKLSIAERERVRLVMVSVDPERDTPQRLKEYTAFFHPEMIGVTGTSEQVTAVATSFGTGYVRQPTRPDGSYAVDHGSQTYVVGPDGKLAAILGLGTAVDDVVAAVRKLL